MTSPQILSTVVDLVDHGTPSQNPSWSIPTRTSSFSVVPDPIPHSLQQSVIEAPTADPELKLPNFLSLLIVILGNALFQVSFFIIVSSASAYAGYLGGSATFSGLVIGIPIVFSGLALIPMTKFDQGQYAMPLSIAYASMLLGNVLYALAYRANYLYLILIGRIVSGFGFTSFMYSKRYCSDPRSVGVRRRTTLASWLVVGQGIGFSAGPFLGGLLYKIGFSNTMFNGFTSPGWVMAGVWAMFWAGCTFLFEDVSTERRMALELYPLYRPRTPGHAHVISSPLTLSTSRDDDEPEPNYYHLTHRQWGVILTMMWYAMTCFFILGAWECNIPVFAATAFDYTPYNSGNFIALGGITTFPFLILNVWYARRVQDRVILALGSSLGLSGLLIMLAILHTHNVTFGSFYICWFLVALGFNLASTCTLSLLSKQLPLSWNGKISMAIQYSNYMGRVTGAVWGGAGVKVGMMNFVGLQVAIVGIGGLLHLTLWRELKAKTG